LQDKVFHSNPVNKNGSLVVTDWGDDLLQRIEEESGMQTEMLTFNDRGMGLDAEFLEVFVSRKSNSAIQDNKESTT